MSTQRDQLANDSLGRTIRETLEMYVRDQLPSDRVWRRIRAGLENSANTDDAENPRRQRPFWIAPLLQVAAVLMLSLVQGVGLHMPATVEPAVVPQADIPAADAVPRSTSEETTLVPTQRRAADLDLWLLKEHSAPATTVEATAYASEPLLTANLGALEMADAGTRRGTTRNPVSVDTVLESRVRQ